MKNLLIFRYLFLFIYEVVLIPLSNKVSSNRNKSIAQFQFHNIAIIGAVLSLIVSLAFIISPLLLVPVGIIYLYFSVRTPEDVGLSLILFLASFLFGILITPPIASLMNKDARKDSNITSVIHNVKFIDDYVIIDDANKTYKLNYNVYTLLKEENCKDLDVMISFNGFTQFSSSVHDTNMKTFYSCSKIQNQIKKD